jgi:type II secretory pathway pseudopilin PulG
MIPFRIRSGLPHGKRRQRGFTYIGVLFIVMAFGLGLASVAMVWHTSVRRDKETELLFVGKQYRQAIASYYASGQREFPARLEDLLLDPRFPSVKRHLRRLYPDPLTGTAEWGLVKHGERIVGIYSLAPGTPLKEVSTGSPDDPPLEGKSYSDWKFAVDPRTQGQAAVPPGMQGEVAVPPAMPGPNTMPGQTVAPQVSDRCEQEQEAAIAACQHDDPAKDADFQNCMLQALQRFQQCQSGG